MSGDPSPADDSAQKCWFVYLIECSDGSIYTGVTTDVGARYSAHAAGKGARYTRSHPPLRLLASIACADRSSALKEEYRIKQLSAAEKRVYAQFLAVRPTKAESVERPCPGALIGTASAAAERDSRT